MANEHTGNDHLTTAHNDTEILPAGRINGSCGTLANESKFLLCSLCSHHYQGPKVLPCLHTFCKSCLDSCTPAQSLTISCPTCRQQSILPPDGVLALHDNVYIAQLVDFIEQRLQCTTCLNEVSTSCIEHSERYNGKDLSTLKLVRTPHNYFMACSIFISVIVSV